MALEVGFASQAPSLPGGGGARGLGETFTPDLSTGTGNLAIPLDVPNGPNDIGPKLSLAYSSAGTNGPFGVGWTISLPRIVRSTMRGRPRYSDDDTLVLEGSGPLVRAADGTLRPEVKTGDWRIAPAGDGFLVTDRAGVRYELGVTPDSRISGLADGTWAWLIHRIEDNLGTTANFAWSTVGPQRYLDTISYGPYTLQFAYEPRPDVLRWGRGGFLLETHERCSSIALHVDDGGATTVARRWSLGYSVGEPNGVSQLTTVHLTGVARDGTELSTPPLHLGYSRSQPATLQRVDPVDERSAPPAFSSRKRVELVDWNGDGLPDIIEFGAGGTARVWPNLAGAWGRPQSVGLVPQLAGGSARAALIDLDGDGLADVVRVDEPMRGYQPRTRVGFARPVSWQRAPAVNLDAPTCRVGDLDGDGIVDVVWGNGRSLMLAQRADEDGWQPVPLVVPSTPAGPPTRLDDPHVFAADMSGDGTPDLVRVDGRGVTYWPYLGYGVFAAAVHMDGAPSLPFDVDPRKIFVVDIDGDGCADIGYLDGSTFRWWPNRTGSGFEAPREIAHVSIGDPSNVRFADLQGTGNSALCWSVDLPSGRGRWFALDPLGGVRCGVLTTIENSTGLVTSVSYATSATESVRDITEGHPSASRLPIVLPVVAGVTATDAVTGLTSTIRYRYHEGRFDGVLREFCGFGRVEADEIGDATAPTLRTTRWFHTGTHEGQEPDTTEDRRRARAIRGRLYREERATTDGTAFDLVEQRWEVADGVDSTVVPRLRRVTRSTLEGGQQPVSWIESEQLEWDLDGNVIHAREQSFDGGSAVPTRTLETRTDYANDPTGRFRQRVSRVRQMDGNGNILAETRTEYDDQQWGQVGDQGIVTRRSALAIPDALALEVYGSSTPDFVTLGYTRRPGVLGWWIEQGKYERVENTSGVHGRIIGPRGGVSEIDFDPTGCYPIRVGDALGNELIAEFDSRVYQPVALTDPSGTTTRARFDALARLVARIEPGDTELEPTTAHEYDTAATPVTILTSCRTTPGASRLEDRQFLDGSGRLLERRVTDDLGEVIEAAHAFSARGAVARSYAPRRAAAAAFALPDDAVPHISFRYDAVLRPVRVVRPDGAVKTMRYLPGVVEESDEEDNRIGPGAPHTGTFTRRHVDATGRVFRIDEQLGGSAITSTYNFDVKGNLVEHVDAVGVSTRFTHDLIGRVLRVARPESAQISVLDPAGNVTESRTGTERVVRTFDMADRLVEVRHGAANSAPAARFVYHDNGVAAPADAGTNTAGGRLVRVDDGGGTTKFDYDQRGRVSDKTMTRAGFPRVHLRMTYRSDGLIDSVTYPTGGAVTRVGYGYNRRGLLESLDGVIDQIDYDIAGRRTRSSFANGIVQTDDHDPLSGWRTTSLVSGPAGVLRDVTYAHDLVGNLLSIGTNDPATSWTYTYDDLYRLVTASGSAGDGHYTYDDAGNILSRSDVGAYTYGGPGVPASCVRSAGADAFTYDERGLVATAPWGTIVSDPEGRLRSIARTGGGHDTFAYSASGTLVYRHSVDGAGAVSELWRPDSLIGIEDGQLFIQFTDGNRVVARQLANNRTWLHVDHLGSLVLATDETGAVVLSRSYGPYGDLRSSTGPDVGTLGFATGQSAGPDLVFLGVRWYSPSLGRFLSPDPLVVDAADPMAWNAYAYCRCNPTSYVDPTGRGFWQIFGAVLATIAIIVLAVVVSVCTFGAATPAAAALTVGGISITWSAVFAATMVGIVAGGVIGGIAAARAGGDFGDVVLGVLVGAAVGGWAAFGAAFAGVAVAGGLGLASGTIFTGAVTGAVGGVINGAAMGFAAGFAGGKNNGIKDIMEKVLVGAIVGAALGAALGALSGVTVPKETPREALEHLYTPKVPSAPMGNVPGGLATSASTVGGATVQLVVKTAWAGLGPLAIKAAASAAVQTVLVDAAAGGTAAWFDDLQQYLRTHDVNLGPFNFIAFDL